MDAYDVAYYASMALAGGTLLIYLVWGAANGAFLDPGLLPTALVFTLMGLLGAYAVRLEAEKADAS